MQIAKDSIHEGHEEGLGETVWSAEATFFSNGNRTMPD